MADRREWPNYTDPRLEEQFISMMSYHTVQSEKHQPDRYAVLRGAFMDLSAIVNKMCPPGRAKSLSLTALEEGLMRAIQAIAVGEDDGSGN